MTFGALIALLLAGGTGVASDPPAVLAQLIIRQRLIIRVPTRQPRPKPPVSWREKKGPKCIAAEGLAGAIVRGDSVDLLLRGGGGRVRARLQPDCPPLDYYSGFYIRPGSDGQVCQGRDVIQARSGGACQIERFRKLLPDKRFATDLHK